jgi:putative transposase
MRPRSALVTGVSSGIEIARARRVREWLRRVGAKALSIGPGSPWKNGYVESFNGTLRDELLVREMFDTLLEAKVLIER